MHLSQFKSTRAGFALAFLFLLPACGGGDAKAFQPIQGDPRVEEIYRALEAGLPDAAWTLLNQHGDDLGAEASLLRARAFLVSGDNLGALREMESARTLSPNNPRVDALEVEILVQLERLRSAADTLTAAIQKYGEVASLERSRGLLYLRQPGQGVKGMQALERALELEPRLMFVGFPLAQARLLVGRELLGQRRIEEALGLVLKAREYDPYDVDFRELQAELYEASYRFPEALAIYAELDSEGVYAGSGAQMQNLLLKRQQLQKRYGTFLSTQKKPLEAAKAYSAARALGISDADLGYYAISVLGDQARACIDSGLANLETGRSEAAGDHFRAALAIDPSNLEARNHLGVCLFQGGEYRAAAELWDEVLRAAEELPLELPDPVHLNLARAWRQCGEFERAVGALDRYLERDGAGEWAEETRNMLAALEADKLVRD